MKLGEEKEMVRKMKESGMKLAEIAEELQKSVSWVFSRVEERYSPVRNSDECKLDATNRELEEEERKLLEEIEELEEEVKSSKERERELTVKLNMPLERSYEELVEYRKGRDEAVEVPILPVDAGDDGLTAGEVVDTCVDLNNEAPGQPSSAKESGGGQ